MRDDYFIYGLFYQAFLALVYFLSGSSILCAKVVQILLGSVTCVLTFRLGRRVFGHRVGIAAGAITAVFSSRSGGLCTRREGWGRRRFTSGRG